MTAVRPNRVPFFVACVVVQAAIVYALTVLARSGCAPSTFVIGLGLCFVPYAGALLFADALPSNERAEHVSLAVLFLLGAAFVVAPPLLSDDLYRYLWEGRLWREGFSPYRLPPDDPALAHLRDDIWAEINNKSLASIYPPLSQLTFLVMDLFGGHVWTPKLFGLLAHAVGTVAVARVSDSRRAPLALALNPLLLSEGALNGHLDVLTGAALLGAAWALRRHRLVKAVFAACVAVGLKVVGLVVLPLFARRPPAAFVAVALGSAALLAPWALSRSLADLASGPGQFAARWQGNESGFALVEWVMQQLFDARIAQLGARVLVVGLVFIAGFVLVRRRVPPMRAARALVWMTLLLSPQVHPWYLAWLLPLEVACGGAAGLVWSAAVLCAYAPLDRWVAEGVWDMPLWLQILEYAAVFAALMFDPRRPSIRPKGSG